MPYSERAYFDYEPCKHCADWEENQRLRKIAARFQREERRSVWRKA